RADWGLDNRGDDDLAREQACLRLQAVLAAPYGLRRVLAPTTEHRSFYDALGDDPLVPRDDRTSILARLGARRMHRPPWAPHLAKALEATATIASAVSRSGLPPGHLLGLADAPAPPHPVAVDPLSDGPRYVGGGQGRCAQCAW